MPSRVEKSSISRPTKQKVRPALGLLFAASATIGLAPTAAAQGGGPPLTPEQLKELEKKGFQADPYQPELVPWWPSDKPIFLPESMVPPQMKKKPLPPPAAPGGGSK